MKIERIKLGNYEKSKQAKIKPELVIRKIKKLEKRIEKLEKQMETQCNKIR